jgi:hypothetical protein
MMDKPSERKKDHKDYGDTDTDTVRTFGPCNKRAELGSFWDHAPESVVGLPLSRLLTNNYCKEGGKKEPDLVDEVINGGPPFANVSKPKAIL